MPWKKSNHQKLAEIHVTRPNTSSYICRWRLPRIYILSLIGNNWCNGWGFLISSMINLWREIKRLSKCIFSPDETRTRLIPIAYYFGVLVIAWIILFFSVLSFRRKYDCLMFCNFFKDKKQFMSYLQNAHNSRFPLNALRALRGFFLSN